MSTHEIALAVAPAFAMGSIAAQGGPKTPANIPVAAQNARLRVARRIAHRIEQVGSALPGSSVETGAGSGRFAGAKPTGGMIGSVSSSQDTGAALRKAFLRLPRASQGTTTLGEAARGLRGMGVRVDESEILALAVLAGVKAGKPSSKSTGSSDSQLPGVGLHTRVDFPTFAAMLDPVEMRATSLPLSRFSSNYHPPEG